MLLALLLALAAPSLNGTAETLRRLPAPEARQGVAVGPSDIHAIANYRIARYNKRTGEKHAAWEREPRRQ